MFSRVDYKKLNSRQKETYNFHKVAALLADFGFNCMWLNDDWRGADFIASHIDGNTFLKVQLKTRLTLDRKYNGKDVYIAYQEGGYWYVYPHDEVQDKILTLGWVAGTKSWKQKGLYSWPSTPKKIRALLEQYAFRSPSRILA